MEYKDTVTSQSPFLLWYESQSCDWNYLNIKRQSAQLFYFLSSVMSCYCGTFPHCICQHFIKMPLVLWRDWTDISSPNPKQISMGCSTETFEANTNNGLTEFPLVLMNNHVCRHTNTEKLITWFLNIFDDESDLLYSFHRWRKSGSKTSDVLSNDF